ncbi:MAG TPA: sugar ABC transporter substrate-binding protein [Chloroflexota bacterium]|nr:sugar ABC transporter substrate-binding protein [Chloroflexota bacterium]
MTVRGRTRRIVSALVAIATALSLCAAPFGARRASAQTPVTLTWFMWSASQPEVTAWQHDAALVTQKYPWIHINFQTAAWAQYWTKLQSEAATGQLQDIISLQMQRTPGFSASFRPLNPYMRSSKFDIKSFDPGIVQALSYGGAVRALPYDFGPIVVYYNKAMFAKYHVPYPTFKWTYQTFAKDVQLLSHPAAQEYGINANPTIDDWLPFALSAGAHYLTPDGKLNLTDPKLAQAFQQYAQFDYKDGASPAQSIPLENYTYAQFQAGGIAMFLDGPWDMINLKNSVKFPMGIATIPSVNGDSVSQTAGSGFGVSTTTKDPQDAWLAISVLTSPAAEQYLATSGRAFSARVAQQPYWYKNAVPGAQQVLSYQQTHSVPFLTTKNWNEVETLIQQYGTDVVNDGSSAAKALATVQQQANSQ